MNNSDDPSHESQVTQSQASQALLEKQMAADKAVEELKDGMILGVGSGTTVRLFVERLVNWVKKGEKSIICIPTSYATEMMLRSFNLKISSLWDFPEIDLTIDGADKVDLEGRMIKGLGGALFREKMVASASKNVSILIDSSKWTDKLSPPWVLPVEVSRFGYKLVEKKLSDIGGEWSLRIDQRLGNPFITDDNNFILDGKFDMEEMKFTKGSHSTLTSQITTVEELNSTINSISGVIETGFFLDLCSKVYLADHGIVKEIIIKK